MKTIKFIAAAVMCLLSLSANAQTKMRIHIEGGKQMEIPVSTITSIDWFTNETPPTTPDISPSGVQAVDLGLSVKWANMNIGATSPEKSGYFFQWGDVTTGYYPEWHCFSLEKQKWYISQTTTDADGFDVTTEGYTKYVTMSDASEYGYEGFYDDKTVLDPDDDAAIVNWGGSWRMPTKEELSELCDREKCKWEKKNINGIEGYKVTGPNGNFIFLPSVGFGYRWAHLTSGDFGLYWSSTLYRESCSADCLSPYYYREVTGFNRYFGGCVRAVCP